VIETIEDFMLHAPLKDIEVELKLSRYRDQGFKSQDRAKRERKKSLPAAEPVE
jgi:hypothetical protein